MESVHRKISQTMRNFAWCGFAGCAKFRTVCKIVLHSVLQLLFLLICHAMRNFRMSATRWISSSSFLPCISYWLGNLLASLEKAMKCSKTQILHVFKLQLALPWIAQNSPSFFACFNDKKATKNTKTSQKLISNPC